MHAWSASQLAIQIRRSVFKRITQWQRRQGKEAEKNTCVASNILWWKRQVKILYKIVWPVCCSLFASQLPVANIFVHSIKMLKNSNIRDYQKRLTKPRSILLGELKRSHFSVAMKRVIQKTDTHIQFSCEAVGVPMPIPHGNNSKQQLTLLILYTFQIPTNNDRNMIHWTIVCKIVRQLLEIFLWRFVFEAVCRLLIWQKFLLVTCSQYRKNHCFHRHTRVQTDKWNMKEME